MRKPESRPSVSVQSKAIDLLSRREHSAKELRDKLMQRGYAEDEVAPLLVALQSSDLQCDDRFTEVLVRSEIRRGYGPVRIRQKLQAHAIDDDLVSKHLSLNSDFWLVHMNAAWEKKFSLHEPEPEHEHEQSVDCDDAHNTSSADGQDDGFKYSSRKYADRRSSYAEIKSDFNKSASNRAKQMRFLLYRGYPADLVSKYLRNRINK